MLVNILKAKIHRAQVTQADMNYMGSITIDRALCEGVGILNYEKVSIYNITNSERFSTYVIYGEEGKVCLNGAAARRVAVGDVIIVAAYCQMEEKEARVHKPKIVVLNENNKPLQAGG